MSRRTRMTRLGGIIVAAALTGLVTCGWMPDQWPGEAQSSPRLVDDAHLAPGGIDARSVVDRVRRHVAPDPGRPGALRASGDGYEASFVPGGFGIDVDGAELRIALRSAERGGDAIPLTPGAWRAEADVSLRTIGAGLTERVRVGRDNLEWDVLLDAAPPGAGDLLLDAELLGLDAAPRPAADGRAWRLTVGGSALRMGELVVVDATGEELHRALPRVDGTRVGLVVPAQVLAEATYPLTVDPVVGPERAVTGPPPAPLLQDGPQVAFDGTNYLVVWTDDRGGPGIFGARVSPDGTVLDPTGFVVSSGGFRPALAFDGINYLVVWAVLAGGIVITDIRAARVTPGGTVLDPTPIVVSSGLDNGGVPAVAFDGTNYLVVWSDSSGLDSDVFATRVTSDGTVLDPTGIPVTAAAPGSQSSTDVAFDGTNYLVVWEDSRTGSGDVFATRVSPAGTVLDPTGFAVSAAPGRQSSPDIAFDGTNYLVVWSDQRSGPDYAVFATRVRPNGTVLDGAATGFAVSNGPATESDTTVAFDGTNYLVVWSELRDVPELDVVGARVTKGGAVLDPAGVPIASARRAQLPAVAFDGTNYLVVWADILSGATGPVRLPPRPNGDIVGTRVTRGGTVLDGVETGFVISTGPSAQADPAVAFDGTNYLVVWEDSRHGAPDIFGARVTPSGTVLDRRGFAVASQEFTDQRSPVVDFDGTNFLVVWEDGRSGTQDIFGARVTPDGSVLDAGSPLTISDAAGDQTSPAIAFNGTNHLVVWSDFRNGSTSDIRGARVTPGGNVLDGPATGFAVSSAPGDQSSPAVDFDGTNHLVAWTDFRSGSTSDIYGARVTPGTNVLDTAATGFAVSTAPSVQSFAAVAFDGTRHLVVWRDLRHGPANSDIYGTRVSVAGQVLDGRATGIPISDEPKNQSAPTVAANGPFLVAWRDRRSATFDVFGARVNGGNGAVQDPNGFVVAGGPTAEQSPAVASALDDDWTVVYQRYDAAFGTDRPFMRTVSPK